MKLTEKTKEKIQNNEKCKAMLCYHLQKNQSTIWRALNVNGDNALLTSKQALIIISKELGIQEKDILTASTYK